MSKRKANAKQTQSDPNKNDKNDKNEKNNKEVFDFSFLEVEYKEAFETWIEYKKEKKQAYKTQKSIETCYYNLKMISEFDPTKAKQIVFNSIANNWAGLFKPKTETKTKQDEQRDYISRRIFEITGNNQ